MKLYAVYSSFKPRMSTREWLFEKLAPQNHSRLQRSRKYVVSHRLYSDRASAKKHESAEATFCCRCGRFDEKNFCD